MVSFNERRKMRTAKINHDKGRMDQLKKRGLELLEAFKALWRENREVISREDLEVTDRLEWHFLDDDELFETNLVLNLTTKRFRELSQRPSGRFDTWEDTIPQYGYLPPDAECLKTTGRRKSDKRRYYLVLRRGEKSVSFKEIALKEEELGI